MRLHNKPMHVLHLNDPIFFRHGLVDPACFKVRSAQLAPVDVSFIEGTPNEAPIAEKTTTSAATTRDAARTQTAYGPSTSKSSSPSSGTTTSGSRSPRPASRQSRSPRGNVSNKAVLAATASHSEPFAKETRESQKEAFFQSAATHRVQSSRFSRKGLDVSPAMLEFFGGKSALGPDACFERMEARSSTSTTHTTDSKEAPTPAVEPDVKVSEPHENAPPVGIGSNLLNESALMGTQSITYKRRKDGRREDIANTTDIGSEPGPEFVDDRERLDGSTVAAQKPFDSEEHEEVETMTISSSGRASSEWEETGENVLIDSVRSSAASSQRSSRSSRHQVDNGEPGPEHYGGEEISGTTIVEEVAQAKGQAASVPHENGQSELEQQRGAAENGEAASAASGVAGAMPVAAQAPILIRGAQIVNDDSIFNADVLIEDRVIKQVSTSLDAPNGATVIDGSGKLLLPAGIDVHTDFSSANSADDFATGSKAALAGGTATVIDVVLPRAGESILAACDRVRKAAEMKSLCNFGFSVVISTWSDVVKKEIGLVVKDKAINSFIMDLRSDDQLFQAFEFCKTVGAHARVLPENKNIVSFLERKMLSLGVTGPEGYLQSRPESASLK
ncbi:Dihydropyrimidinase-related protein 1 [Toxocara canis]|uniref:Dihydropyrimidinase-related protein 1 n=1 Tax=Toxocara canis TaxID=6265 RepID=A0A0B2VWG9_TOXCA|nr:Dihydropyrimidinase-related protein 1 [Toxocara canis]